MPSLLHICLYFGTVAPELSVVSQAKEHFVLASCCSLCLEYNKARENYRSVVLLSHQVTRKLLRTFPESWQQVTFSRKVKWKVFELTRGPRTERWHFLSHLPKFRCVLGITWDRCCCCFIYPFHPFHPSFVVLGWDVPRVAFEWCNQGLLTPCCPCPSAVGDPLVLKAALSGTDTESSG